MRTLTLHEMLKIAVDKNCSDLHLTVGVPPTLRYDGSLLPIEDCPALTPDDTRELCFFMLDDAQKKCVADNGEVDFSYSVYGLGRFRVNCYRQRHSYAAAIRIFRSSMPTIDGLGLPAVLKELALKRRGLIIVTGATGTGKSTTLAAMIDFINHNRRAHIITIEDPIEYLHAHNTCIINQREVSADTVNFPGALRSALREDPDIILLGEMRDLETISTAISAAETGHLVLSTLHTMDAPSAVERIIDMFAAQQQQQIRIQLASSLQGIVSQQLIKQKGALGRVAAFEVLLMTDAVRNQVREAKTYQIVSTMQTGIKAGMMPMDYSLSELVIAGKITLEDAYLHCFEKDNLRHFLASRGNAPS
ncbi:MAG: type IV pilus twitching motility protein PilT [Clostridia bacterium]|nr:type IV pilus twitching motility protein PilT [Clostridia bacterium]MDR3645424.1 type IV pilus twitching motility protein PilT [Clostridia bacterium]